MVVVSLEVTFYNLASRFDCILGFLSFSSPCCDFIFACAKHGSVRFEGDRMVDR